MSDLMSDVFACVLIYQSKFTHLLFRSPKMDLESALKDCNSALELFLNNRFADALALLKPW